MTPCPVMMMLAWGRLPRAPRLPLPASEPTPEDFARWEAEDQEAVRRAEEAGLCPDCGRRLDDTGLCPCGGDPFRDEAAPAPDPTPEQRALYREAQTSWGRARLEEE